MKKEFLMIEWDLYSFNELNRDEITILAFILSHLNNNQKFYYTNQQIVDKFNSKFEFQTIKRILTSLEEKEFIQRKSLKHQNENKSWGNRREILFGCKLNLEPCNELTTSTVYEDIPQPNIVEEKKEKEVKINLNPPDETISSTKYEDILESEIFKQNKPKSENGKLNFSNDFHNLISELN